MKRILTALLLLCLSTAAFAQQFTLRHHLVFQGEMNPQGLTGGSDCWGWTSPEGVDYAIMGTWFGTHYVRADDGAVLDSVRGAMLNDSYYHRDIKTYRNYAYICGEMSGPHEGVQIVDLSYLPDSVHWIKDYTYGNFARSHNLNIDTATAHMYVLASDYSGVRIISIADPENPVDVGFVNAPSLHDVYCRNDTLYVAEGGASAYSVWDVSDKQNPVMMGRIANMGFGYAHNIWPTDDGRYFVTAEETGGKTVKIWDFQNPANITLTSEISAPCSLVHNVQVKGNRVFCSYYESGLVAIDITNPASPTIADQYDCYPPSENPQFHGTWGCFPYAAGNYIYGSNIEGDFFIMNWTESTSATAPESALSAQLQPNPAQEGTQLQLSMQQAGPVTVTATDLAGRSLGTLWHGNLAAGEQRIDLELPATLPAGMLLLRVQTPGNSFPLRLMHGK